MGNKIPTNRSYRGSSFEKVVAVVQKAKRRPLRQLRRRRSQPRRAGHSAAAAWTFAARAAARGGNFGAKERGGGVGGASCAHEGLLPLAADGQELVVYGPKIRPDNGIGGGGDNRK
jgi:hypothetical protein